MGVVGVTVVEVVTGEVVGAVVGVAVCVGVGVVPPKERARF
jgi:ABC-type nitrate/sulfonate/bicarbonate transport system permease component